MSELYRANLKFSAELRGVLIRVDGTHLDYGVLSVDELSVPRWRGIYSELKRGRHIPVIMTFAAFLSIVMGQAGTALPFLFGLVTTVGVNYMAADFLAASAARINAFKYHDSGEGTTGANVGDTVLEVPTGDARISGVGTNPTANQYRSIGTITYAAPKSVAEWGLFSASTVGTLWDRRTFAAHVVTAGQGIQFTYTLTVTAGG